MEVKKSFSLINVFAFFIFVAVLSVVTSREAKGIQLLSDNLASTSFSLTSSELNSNNDNSGNREVALVINEVMASNSKTIADEDGDYEDWIEIFNGGTEPINLEGYGLSDNYSNPFKWVFPDVSIQPGEYLLVWASGKNRRPVQDEFIPGLVREVYAGIPGHAVSDLTNHISYPDDPTSRGVLLNLFEAPTNVADNYGQRVHGLIKAPATGQYRFWIASDDHSQLFLSTSDNPENAVMLAEVPGWTNPRQWTKYSQQQSVLITLQEGEYYYIKALMKEQEGGDNLAVGWQLPNGTFDRPISGQHLFRTESQLHTNFSISRDGEEIILTHPSGVLISEMEPTAIPSNISRGRFPDGANEWFFFAEPTPGMPNITQPYSEVLSPPGFSVAGGFFEDGFDLELSHPEDGVQVFYTLDGSVPDPYNLDGTTYQYKNQYPQNSGDPFGVFLENSFVSFLFSNPINIYDRSSEPNKLAEISTTWHRNPNYFPLNPVNKGLVVKASAHKDGAIPSNVITHTYFVNSEGINNYTIPLLSVSLQEDGLFGYSNGIYVAGQIFDQWRASNLGVNANGGTPANYWLRGDFTESVAHLELFEASSNQASLSQEMGVRLHGGWSRASSMKSLRLYARARYGDSHFNYPFFPNYGYNSFRRLILRNSGNDYGATLFRDAATQKIVSHLNFSTQNYQPSVVFINGEYWGIHNLRERFDKHFLERMFGVDPENIDLLEFNASAVEGDADHYNAMIGYVQANPLSVNSNYEHIKTQMDVECFIDYQLSNIFAANTDWPGNNIKFWRLKTNQYEPNAPYGHDGKWRWMLYDTDFGFGYASSISHNTLQFATEPNGPGWPNPSWSTFLFRKLLENPSFEFDFIIRFADLLNTTFLPERMVGVINEMKQVLEPEISEHISRWRNSTGGGSVNNWNNHVNHMVAFANQRTEIQRQHLRSFFNLGLPITVTVDVSDQEHGYVRVNTIDVVSETPGVSHTPYPWQGKYFSGMEIELEAIALPGYTFVGWEGYVDETTPVISITPSENLQVTANFLFQPQRQLIHYWHFNNENISSTNQVFADYSAVSEAIINYEGTGSGYLDFRSHRAADPVSNYNLRLNQEPNIGAVLRARNPANTKELTFEVPSNGFKDLEVEFATTRTSNGAQQQEFYFSPDAGNTWIMVGDVYEIPLLDPSVENFGYLHKVIDLGQYEELENNPELKFKIKFVGEGADNSSGNNRIDNFSVEGMMLHYNIVASAGVGGAITPSGEVKVNYGATQTFEIAPGTGYEIADVVVDDFSVGAVSGFTFNNVNTNHTIEASFRVLTSVAELDGIILRVFPNPVKNILTVESNVLISQIRIIDLLGKELRSEVVSGFRREIDVTMLEPGLYFIQVLAPEGSKTVKIQVAR